MDVTSQLAALFAASNRLYRLDGSASIASLQIERWSGREVLSGIYRWEVYALATDPALNPDAMLGQRISIDTALADGSIATRSGLVAEAACIDYDGALARYRLQLVPWLEALAHGSDLHAGVGRHARASRRLSGNWCHQTVAGIAQFSYERSGCVGVVRCPRR